MIDRFDQLEYRIHRLERSRRRWRNASGVVIVLALLAGASRQQADDEIRARRIVVLDDKDVPRIVMGQDPADTQRRSRSTGITIHDPTGAERFGVGVMDDNTVNMGFDAAAGVGDPMRDRLALGVSPSGSPYVMLINNETKVPVRLVADSEKGGGGGVEFIDYDRTNSKVIIRRISFGADETKSMPHEFPPDEPATDDGKKK